ncbi:VOC family protein [Gallaecimonas sp. GXIMD4217]|uniref:VOC family protein n=1 Tax=Gallaecimonas sp. GXIMD4217 TaxID=3131927 RepID=UPI00311AEF16
MTQHAPSTFPHLRLGHIELFVTDADVMESFYTQFLGFVVTDRGNDMVFLSRHPDEHHQIVFSPKTATQASDGPLDHIAFRVDNLGQLRVFHQSLAAGNYPLRTVSHGTAWSIYFKDPEGNHLEIYTPTPWYVSQPCRFEIDLAQDDDELLAATLARVQALPGFAEAGHWAHGHRRTLEG